MDRIFGWYWEKIGTKNKLLFPLFADNHKVLKAVICAGLYPNVAKLDTTSLKKWRWIHIFMVLVYEELACRICQYRSFIQQVDRKAAQNLLKLCKVIYHSTWGSDSVLLGCLVWREISAGRPAAAYISCMLCVLHAHTHRHTHCKFWCRGEISVCLAYQNNTIWSKASEVTIDTRIFIASGLLNFARNTKRNCDTPIICERGWKRIWIQLDVVPFEDENCEGLSLLLSHARLHTHVLGVPFFISSISADMKLFNFG